MLFGNQIPVPNKLIFNHSPSNNNTNPKPELTSFRFFNPQDHQSTITIPSANHTFKENKMFSQSFSLTSMPAQPSPSYSSHNDDGFVIPLNKKKLVENVEAIGEKKSFFNKNESFKVERKARDSSYLAEKLNSRKQQHLFNVSQNINQPAQSKRTFFHRSKSPINNHKTENFEKIQYKVNKVHRASQIPQIENIHHNDLNDQFSRPQSNKKLSSYSDALCESFGPSQKKYLIPEKRLIHKKTLSRSSNGINNEGRNKLSTTPSKFSNKKSQSNLKATQKYSKPNFIPSSKSINRFIISKSIGGSQMSEDFICIQKKSLAIYCLKIIKKAFMHENPQTLMAFIKKLSLQLKMNHPNVIQIYDIFNDHENVYILQQYMEGRSLRTHLSKLKSQTQDTSKKQSNLIDKMLNVNSALSYVHNYEIPNIKPQNQIKVFHGDIRPSNVLLSFGLCKISLMNFTEFKKNKVLTDCYVSPQVLVGQSLTSKSDMWNLGLMIYQYASGKELLKLPIAGEKSLADQIVDMDIPKEIGELQISQTLKQVLKYILKVRPDDRPNSSQIAKSATFKNHGQKPFDLFEKNEKKTKSQHVDSEQSKMSLKQCKKTHHFIPHRGSKRNSIAESGRDGHNSFNS